MTSAELVTNQPGPVVTPPLPVKLSFIETLVAEIKASPWYQADGGFIGQAMTATTLAEATDTAPVVPKAAKVGPVYRWFGARFADSELDGTLPIFALCDVVDPATGERMMLTCGGGRVVATLFNGMKRGDWFPFDASLTEVELEKGKFALNLVPAPVKVTNTKR